MRAPIKIVTVEEKRTRKLTYGQSGARIKFLISNILILAGLRLEDHRWKLD